MLCHDWFHDWGIDMTYTLKPNGNYMYVMRKPTQSECDLYIRNGYTPPELDREHDRAAYMYARGETKPNYPMPAIITEIALWRNCVMLFKDNDTEPFKMWIG